MDQFDQFMQVQTSLAAFGIRVRIHYTKHSSMHTCFRIYHLSVNGESAYHSTDLNMLYLFLTSLLSVLDMATWE